jgi:protein-disulfide isomerase
VLVAVVAVVLSQTLGGKKHPTPAVAAADESAISGIPQHDLVLGKAGAKFTLTEYIDTSCPICRDYALSTFPSIASTYVRTGKLRVEIQPLAFVGPSSKRGRELLLAAAQQNKAFQLEQMFYRNQGDETTAWLTDDFARAIAAKVPGLNVTTLFADATSATIQAEAAKADAQAKVDKVGGTPTFVLTTPDGQRHSIGSGNPGFAAFQRLLDSVLKG